MSRIWYWRARLCETLIGIALRIAPRDYTPSCVQAVIDTARAGGNPHKVLEKAFPKANASPPA